MIWETPDTDYTAILESAPTGLVGTVAVRVINPALPTSDPAHTVIARHTGQITEQAPGVYAAALHSSVAGGLFLIVWDLGDPADAEHTYSEELFVTNTPVSDTGSSIAPTLGDVGSQIYVRTKDNLGNYLGTFTTATRPTNDQVLNLIAKALASLTDKIGSHVPLELIPAARNVATLRSAMMVERSFFGDQINAGRSVYSALTAEYEAELKALLAADALISADDPGEADELTLSGMPVWSFPPLAPTRAPGADTPLPERPEGWDW